MSWIKYKSYICLCIIISKKLGKILFMEKLDVIKKIFWILNSNILLVIILLNNNNVCYLQSLTA